MVDSLAAIFFLSINNLLRSMNERNWICETYSHFFNQVELKSNICQLTIIFYRNPYLRIVENLSYLYNFNLFYSLIFYALFSLKYGRHVFWSLRFKKIFFDMFIWCVWSNKNSIFDKVQKKIVI